jgi:hypothetical protein
MEHFDITKTALGFHVEGFPNAVRLVQIDGPKAQRLADLSLHKSDLDFAADCLAAINQVPEEPTVFATALWRSAVIHYMKCFGDSGARFQLSAEKIYRGEPPEALVNFQLFRDLRNKHLVHDENSYAQSVPGAVLNKGNKSYKIEKIICLKLTFEVLGQESYNNLKLLIDKAHAWVVSEFDALCEILAKELETESYQRLSARQSVNYRVPTVEDMGKNRKDAP